MTAREGIQTHIAQTLAQMGLPTLEREDVPLERPLRGALSHGDYTTNVALLFAVAAGKPSAQLAREITESLGEIEGVERIEVAGPGFINFFLTTQSIQAVLEVARTEVWGKGVSRKGTLELYEYTDPNPFKAFHIGHLMSNTIGESLSRLAQNAGADVVRANYQGDLGVHVACALWGIKKLGINPTSAEDFGKAYAEGATAYKESDVAKAEIDILNKKLYDRSDSELNALYDTGRATSLEAFEKIYKTLGTTFDRYYFESETGPLGKEMVHSHPEVFPESEGARVFKGEDYGLHTRVFLNKAGLPTYEAKELGLEKLKQDEYPNAKVFVIVTANEITEYFKVLKKAMEQVLPDVAAKLIHVPHGMMKLLEGKMSSRTGSVITGESLLSDLQEGSLARATQSRAENPQELALHVAVGAIKFQILRQGVRGDIIFNREQALSMEGDSGPYLQYAHARCVSLTEKGTGAGVSPVFDVNGVMPDLVRHLIHFPEVAERAANEFEPHHVTTFLIELASAFNAWYAQEKIMDMADTAHKLAIVDAVRQTLAQGLWLLGIPAPHKM